MDPTKANSQLEQLYQQYVAAGKTQQAQELRQYIDSGWTSAIRDMALSLDVNKVLMDNGFKYGVPAAQQAQGQQQGTGQGQGAGTGGGAVPVPNITTGGGISQENDNGIGGGGPAAAAATAANAQQVTQTPTAPATPALPATGSGGPINANSAIGSTLYTRSQQGDTDALDLLMVDTLQKLGLDPFSGSAATQSIMKTLYPYLQLVMSYSGIGDPKAALDQGRDYANRFSNMISTPGTFGQIRQFGQEAAKSIAGRMGDLQDPQQQNALNDILGLTTAGGNAIENTANQNRLTRDRAQYQLANANDPRIDHFINWLASDPQRKANPAYSGLAGLLGR